MLQSWAVLGLPQDLTEVLAISDQLTKLAREFNRAVPNIGAIITSVLTCQGDLLKIKAALSGGVL